MMAEPTYQFPQVAPHRKPLPHLQPDRPYASPSSPPIYTHNRTRTTSSSALPSGLQNQYGNNMYHGQFSKRTPSTSTFSTIVSNANGPPPNRQASNSIDLQRSASANSGRASTISYVALMRKQKATVWCDRAQHEDPRMVAAQRAAKMRAVMEVMGGSAAGRSSTAGSGGIGGNRVAAKIRHHGKSGLTDFTPAENFGVGIGGVPMRLSASEVEGGDSDDDTESGGIYNHRSSSGRSSSGSGRRGLTYQQSGASAHSSGRWSSGNTPPSERERVESLNDLAEETPVATRHYFSTNDNSDGNKSISSGSSNGERADGVAELSAASSNAARLVSNSLLRSAITREKSTKNPDELRRRGSVDERAVSLSTGRLFVANPDMDSD